MWYIGCDKETLLNKEQEIKEKLDLTLKVLNDDYAVERSAALKNIVVHLIPNHLFIDWMRAKGKAGSQNKFPRVLKKELLQDWQSFVASYIK